MTNVVSTIINHPWLGMVTIPPVKMVRLGDGLWHCLNHIALLDHSHLSSQYTHHMEIMLTIITTICSFIAPSCNSTWLWKECLFGWCTRYISMVMFHSYFKLSRWNFWHTICWCCGTFHLSFLGTWKYCRDIDDIV